MAANVVSSPQVMVWDLTYACPLRCIHCYSESGRRASQQLGLDDMLKVADRLIEMKPVLVNLTGGEPLLVKGIFEVAKRLSGAGIRVVLYTGGWTLQPHMIPELTLACDRIVVSVDGATPETHDRIRGRIGSFQRAMNALSLLDDASREQGDEQFQFGIDCVVLRSNFDQIEEYCQTMVARFPRVRRIAFGAGMPTGLGSRVGFAEHELLSDAQVAQLGGDALITRLQSLVPASVLIDTDDNLDLMMHPSRCGQGPGFEVMFVEPDGEVHAMAIYEGTVGSLLTESGDVLWRRCVARWSDSFVIETLSPVRTMKQWAAAVRRMDYHFGSDQVRARIDRRPEYSAPTSRREVETVLADERR
jgi:MoaA/NifB/PqqE/SkfB family radical SAM enzyme